MINVNSTGTLCIEMLFTCYLNHSFLGIITPSIDSIEFSVESAATGVIKITMAPQGKGVYFEGSVSGGTNSMQVVGNVIMLTGLDYTSTHTVNITAANTACPGIEPRSSIVPISFNITCRVIAN